MIDVKCVKKTLVTPQEPLSILTPGKGECVRSAAWLSHQGPSSSDRHLCAFLIHFCGTFLQQNCVLFFFIS